VGNEAAPLLYRHPQIQPCFLKSSGLIVSAGTKAKRFADRDGYPPHRIETNQLQKEREHGKAVPDIPGLAVDS
jgi:hypothetical protein